jgi:hypothetical protein
VTAETARARTMITSSFVPAAGGRDVAIEDYLESREGGRKSRRLRPACLHQPADLEQREARGELRGEPLGDPPEQPSQAQAGWRQW